jgi:hypothetical protein
MNRRGIFYAIGVVALGCLLSIGYSASYSAAQSSRKIVGTWMLVSADGFGPAPLGTLMFDDDGRFSAIFVRSDIPKYVSNSRLHGTADDYKMTVNGSIAAFGTYALSGTDLILHIEGSTFPNWIGTDQTRRNVTVSANELKYTQPKPSAGGSPVETVWKRAAMADGSS